MPFSHHSHSGQFCGHATNTLEEVVQNAVAKGMTTFCMTEHMPRARIDFYPEEESQHSEASLAQLFEDYYQEARRLQTAYADRIQLFVGFEGEWVRPGSLDIIQGLLAKHDFDLFVGSVHHLHGIPIDYDTTHYHKSRDVAGGTDVRTFEDYFDAQYDMLKALRPPVVGHFDLIRLKSDEPDRSLKSYGKELWEKVLRNLRFMAEYGGIVEVNGSALRKGLAEAYPQVEICKEFLAMGGRFTLSDDSHGIDQVGLNYAKAFSSFTKAGVAEIYHLAPVSDTVKSHDERSPKVGWQRVTLAELSEHRFWKIQ